MKSILKFVVLSIAVAASIPFCSSVVREITGSVFAGIAAGEMVFSMASALGANVVYDATVAIYGGFTFFVMAGYGVIGIILCLVLIIGQRGSESTSNVREVTVSVSQDIVKLGNNNIQRYQKNSSFSNESPN